MAKTIIQKILDAHTILKEGGRALVYVDRLVIADTALGIFDAMRAAGHEIRRPGQALVVPDHYVASSGPGLADVADDARRRAIAGVEDVARRSGMRLFGLGDPRRGIQHVVATEQGYALPGITVATVDSHATTQSAVGALAFSIGPDLGHVLATQCVWIKSPNAMRIVLDGHLRLGVTAKDVALNLTRAIGAAGAADMAVEFAGDFIRDLSPEGRMTLCNMSVEMGARLGIVAPDERTFAYLRGRPFAPKGQEWDRALAFWRTLPSDADARFDRELAFDVSEVEPMVTWGLNAESAIPITGVVPDPAAEPDAQRRAQSLMALDYMGLTPGTRAADIRIDRVFIGSCTNARIEDLRAAGSLLDGRRVAVPTLVVPGSGLVKAQAEAEGLDVVFRRAGASWGEAGCSMCVSMNGDAVPPGERCASTSNRSHMGRQGRGSRTHLLSPLMAAAAAVAGRLTDVRDLEAR